MQTIKTISVPEKIEQAKKVNAPKDSNNEKFNNNRLLLQEQVKEAMKTLKKFKLSEESMLEIESVMNFCFQTKNLHKLANNGIPLSCNILLQSESDVEGTFLAREIARACDRGEETTFSEKDILESGLSNFPEDYIEMKDVLIINGCQRRPLDDGNIHGSIERSEVRARVKKYDKFWDKVLEIAKKDASKMIIVVASKAVCKSSISKNKAIYNEMLNHHIKLMPQTLGSIKNSVIQNLKADGFVMDKSFNDKLAEYIKANQIQYEREGLLYAGQIVRRIKEKFFEKEISDMSLTGEHIPKLGFRHRNPDEIFKDFDKMTGLNSVKEELFTIYKQNKLMPASGKGTKKSYHLLFRGNPGTGKSTVGKLVAELFYSMGIIKTNHCEFAGDHDIISMYQGGTSDKISTKIENALDGVLFIDEAHSLTRDKGAAIKPLLQAAEEYADRLVIVLAGYKHEFDELYRMDAGFKERFPRVIDFPDYSCEELVEIFDRMCKADGVKYEETVPMILAEYFAGRKVQKDFANGRTVKNVFQKLLEKAALDDSNVIREAHVKSLIPKNKDFCIEDMVAQDSLKGMLNELGRVNEFNNKRKEIGLGPIDSMNLNMLFMGNPGTGKTTAAKLVADKLYSMKILKTNNVTVLERSSFIGSHVGETEEKTRTILSEAYGGVVFIDEAYSLLGDGQDYGKRVVEILLTAMLEHKEDTVFILAGYPREMTEFLASNSGLSSRFGYKIMFKDYTLDELKEIFRKLCIKNGFSVSRKVIDRFGDVAEYFMTMVGFGNGRFVDQVFQQTYLKKSKSNFKDVTRISVRDIPTIQEMIEMVKGTESMHNPDEISKEQRLRVAYHELGHAVASLYGGRTPKSITIKDQIGSLGHVSFDGLKGNLTEDQCMDYLVMCISGRNAEKVLLGNSSIGCSEDYKNAKEFAEAMVSDYAMGELGVTTAMDFIKTADKTSMEILGRYKLFIEDTAKQLLDKRSITGEALKKSYDEFVA